MWRSESSTGSTAGETGFVTIAAVDQGILNLTGFDTTPDAPGTLLSASASSAWGCAISMAASSTGASGNRGALRSGGAAGAQTAACNRHRRPKSSWPIFSGPIEVEPRWICPYQLRDARLQRPGETDGRGLEQASGVGKAEADVLVRDPAVADGFVAAVPRARGFRTMPAARAGPCRGPDRCVRQLQGQRHGRGNSTPCAMPTSVTLEDGGKAVLELPLLAGDYRGWAKSTLAVTTPGGKRLTKPLKLPVQVNDPETAATTTRFPLAAWREFHPLPRCLQPACAPAPVRQLWRSARLGRIGCAGPALRARPLPLWLYRAGHEPGAALALLRSGRTGDGAG